MNNQEYLKAVMAANGLQQKDIAEICGVKPPTVTGWLADPSVKYHRPMADRMIDLLKLKLRQKKLKVRVD